MQTTKWGPPGWTFLHIISFNYPLVPTETDKRNYKSFFTHMAKMLPCKYCRESYTQYIKEMDNFLDYKSPFALLGCIFD